MVFILGDTNTKDLDQEDENNIVRALAVTRADPDVKMRLLLLRPENKEQAVRVGLRRHFCFSLNELKVNIMSQSVRCPGFSTWLVNLTHSTSPSLGDPCDGK